MNQDSVLHSRMKLYYYRKNRYNPPSLFYMYEASYSFLLMSSLVLIPYSDNSL